MDGTVRNLLSYFSASLLGLGFISFGAPDLAVFQLSTLPLLTTPSPGLRLPLCLPVTYGEPKGADSGEAQSQDTDLPTNSLIQHSPGCKAWPIAELMYLQKVGSGLVWVTRETILSSPTRHH